MTPGGVDSWATPTQELIQDRKNLNFDHRRAMTLRSFHVRGPRTRVAFKIALANRALIATTIECSDARV
jgi:hypothetical protein